MCPSCLLPDPDCGEGDGTNTCNCDRCPCGNPPGTCDCDMEPYDLAHAQDRAIEGAL